jgi:hypothetical protein
MKREPKSFVVQLDPDAAADPDRPVPISGRAESLDSGRVVRFGSGRGLLRFLRSALFEQRPAPAAEVGDEASATQQHSEIRRKAHDEGDRED